MARLDRRTKRLVNRLNPGDIAIIDHVDLDRVARRRAGRRQGRGRRQRRSPRSPAATRTSGRSCSSRAGILLLDNVGAEIFTAVKEGSRVRVDGDTVYLGDEPVAAGTLQDDESIAAADGRGQGRAVDASSRRSPPTRWSTCSRERALLLDGVGVPDVRTQFEGRHVLIVVRGYDYKADLRALRPYIREYQAGADRRRRRCRRAARGRATSPT